MDIKKTFAAGGAALMLASTLAMPLAAFADTQPTVTGRDTDGTTDLYVQLANGEEHGESDGNLTFTVPSQIDFVLKADGTVVGPSSDATYIENGSNFAIHNSSLQVTHPGEWQLIASGEEEAHYPANGLLINITKTSSDGATTVDYNLGDYIIKNTLPHQELWNMASSPLAASTTYTDDEAHFSIGGTAYTVTNDVSSRTKFATIQWYVTPGTATGE